jgi:signal transduction histidine kinase
LDPRVISLVCGLGDPTFRQDAANRAAEAYGAVALLILVRDEETGKFRPAYGFKPSLPGGPLWRDFLRHASTSERHAGEVAFPDLTRSIAACSIRAHGLILILLGASNFEWDGIQRFMPLLGGFFIAENKLQSAHAREVAAAESSRQANQLASALDAARAEVADSADQLRRLNANLEQRVAEEIERRANAEAALRQAQKLEAIGQLTGGVAHDFNNLLTIVMGGLDAIKRQIPSLPASAQLAKITRALNMAEQGSQRAATLTARLLAFSRRQPLDPKPLDVDRVIGGMAEMLRSTLGERVRVEIVGAAGLWRALADQPELEHAVLNLAVNARDAMPNGGRLTIETGNIYLDETYVSTFPEPVPPGQYVLVAVTDSGTGIEPELLERVFEPFFTTKEVGKGTGLGLSQVYGFIRQTGGHIRIYSELGVGTTVKLFLPRAEKPAERLEEALHVSGLVTGDETILLVEDHDDLRAYAASVLRELGYTVLEAEFAKQALELLRGAEFVHLLFTDVVLPEGMDGRQLADEALRLRPGLKVLFTTGYSRNAIVHNGRLDAGVQLLSKPFSFQSLAEKVRRVLDAR